MANTRTALVTGASRGIGEACARTLGAAGYRLILAARSRERLGQVAGELAGIGVEAHVLTMDLADHAAIGASMSQALKEFGRVDVLVNNAGLTKDGLAMRMKAEDWTVVLQTNLTAAFQVIQQVLPGMMKERWGRIINITSVVGEMGNAGQANYVASKAGLIGLTKSLAQEVGSRHITVNAVSPGFIETDMTGVLSPELKEKMIAQTPLRRMGAPAEIAAAVKFLASDDASFITGHVLSVNGGIYM